MIPNLPTFVNFSFSIEVVYLFCKITYEIIINVQFFYIIESSISSNKAVESSIIYSYTLKSNLVFNGST